MRERNKSIILEQKLIKNTNQNMWSKVESRYPKNTKTLWNANKTHSKFYSKKLETKFYIRSNHKINCSPCKSESFLLLFQPKKYLIKKIIYTYKKLNALGSKKLYICNKSFRTKYI